MDSPIAPRYYLDNFRTALNWVEARSNDLLRSNERDFLMVFAQLPDASQALLVRLVMRSKVHFRQHKLGYAEVGDISSAADPLLAASLLADDWPITSVELADLLLKDELGQVLSSLGLQKISRKSDMLLLLEQANLTPRPFTEWCGFSMDNDQHDRLLTVTISETVERLRLLFFGNHHQAWKAFVLADLGVQRFEAVALSPSARGFQSLAEVNAVELIAGCRQALYLGEVTNKIWQSLQLITPLDGYVHSRWHKCALAIGRQAEKEHNWELARAIYAQCEYSGARLRLIRIYEKTQQHQAAHDLAQIAWQSPESASETQALLRCLPRIAKCVGSVFVKPEPSSNSLNEWALTVPSGDRVEYAVKAALNTDERSVWYVENTLFTSVFGLLFWPVIFAPISGAFFHPFQRGPADLFRPGFVSSRATLIDSALSSLKSNEYRERIWATWRNKQGIQSPFVVWEILTEQLLTLALDCIPAHHWHVIFERMLMDLSTHSSGLPDLIAFYPKTKTYELIEVKGPGDSLQDNQRQWLQFFGQHEIYASLCWVSWKTA